MAKLYKYITIPLIVMAVFSSCKTLPFQNLLTDVKNADTVRIAPFIDAIQPGDILNIQLNAPNTASLSMFAIPTTGQKCKVNSKGDIFLPVVGNIHAAELSIDSLSSYLKLVFAKDISTPVVNVSYEKYQVTVLSAPDKSSLLQSSEGRITVIDAIAAVQGLSEIQSMKVRVIRLKNGLVMEGIVDLNDKRAFQSPYYNLRQNDIVIIEEAEILRSRKARSESIKQVLPAVMTGISLLASLLFIIDRL